MTKTFDLLEFAAHLGAIEADMATTDRAIIEAGCQMIQYEEGLHRHVRREADVAGVGRVHSGRS